MTAITKTSAKTGSSALPARGKVERAAKTFKDPMEVLTDPSLSTKDKRDVLNSLEQDARQLAVATAEGMDGGEETKLHRVLQAKRMTDMPGSEAAFSTVTRNFEALLPETQGTDTHELITRALDAIRAARDAIAARSRTPAPPPGAPLPGSQAELQEELEKEKLDPGA